MDGDNSTPIESVLEVEKEHSEEANQVLAELSGSTEPVESKSVPMPAVQSPMYADGGMTMDHEDDVIMDVDEEDTSLDFWILMIATVAVVFVSIIVFFSPKVRVMLEPFIGTGYMSLSIRALVIGVISTLPTLLLM